MVPAEDARISYDVLEERMLLAGGKRIVCPPGDFVDLTPRDPHLPPAAKYYQNIWLETEAADPPNRAIIHIKPTIHRPNDTIQTRKIPQQMTNYPVWRYSVPRTDERRFVYELVRYQPSEPAAAEQLAATALRPLVICPAPLVTPELQPA